MGCETVQGGSCRIASKGNHIPNGTQESLQYDVGPLRPAMLACRDELQLRIFFRTKSGYLIVTRSVNRPLPFVPGNGFAHTLLRITPPHFPSHAPARHQCQPCPEQYLLPGLDNSNGCRTYFNHITAKRHRGAPTNISLYKMVVGTSPRGER